ncbi:DUF3592 domain-containing protein [Streptomyces sp. NPDC048604]|uniref:DUF3592 domain-containing protein n=1 Tax=Streptomyces sp. NPDC048604 TaxID=3365578 RepID=UPI00371A489F
MQILPGGTPTFLLLFGLFAGFFAVRSALRFARVLRLVRLGARADGWCAERRVLERSGMDNSYATEYVYAFRTPDGREISFTDPSPSAFGFEEGAPVRVSYDPAAPEKRATIAGPGAWRALVIPAVLAVVIGLMTLLMLWGFGASHDWW